MDFTLIVTVLFSYFVRPQDWLPGMAGTNIMRPLMGIALIAMFTRRRGFSAASLVKTPVDWAILAYAAYIVLAAPEGQRPVSAVFVFVAYYFVTAQAITTPRQLTIYLRCWLVAIMVVAGMAIMSEHGLDLTGAKDLTHKIPDKPRLALNTYLFDNANALGHTVVLAIPLAYFVFFWRRPFSRKLIALAIIAMATYCVFLTKSKGAYIVGFLVVVATQIMGRRRIFQLVAVMLAGTIGWGALSSLPRMTEISSARQDEAIMGRMLAWEQARLASREFPNGEGYRNFEAYVLFDGDEIPKATHSSYVLIGAELGVKGMFFFLAVLYASGRVLLTARCQRQRDEAARRTMFVILLGYLLSSWLIDRSYHLEYFLLAGAVSAFHRRLGVEAKAVSPEGEVAEDEYGEEDDDDELDRDLGRGEPVPGEGAPEPRVEEDRFAGPALAYLANARADGGNAAPQRSAERPAGAAVNDHTFAALESVDTSEVAEEAIEEELTRRWYWRKFTLIDLVLVVLFTKLVFEFWDYALETYFS